MFVQDDGNNRESQVTGSSPLELFAQKFSRCNKSRGSDKRRGLSENLGVYLCCMKDVKLESVFGDRQEKSLSWTLRRM